MLLVQCRGRSSPTHTHPAFHTLALALHVTNAIMLHVTLHWGHTMSTNAAERVQKHRAGLRAAGLRPVQIWVPDTRRSDFAAECRRQSLMLRNDPQEADILGWLEAAADTEGWE